MQRIKVCLLLFLLAAPSIALPSCTSVCELCADGTDPQNPITCACLPCEEGPSGPSGNVCEDECQMCSDGVTEVCPDPEADCELPPCPPGPPVCTDLSFNGESFALLSNTDVVIQESDVQATTVAGGNVDLTSFFIGGDLIAQGDVDLSRGAICGNVEHGGGFSGDSWQFSCGGSENPEKQGPSSGEIIDSADFAFDAAREHFQAMSECLFQEGTCSGTTSYESDSKTLNFEYSGGEDYDLFCIECQQLEEAAVLNFVNFPSDANAIINVFGPDTCVFKDKGYVEFSGLSVNQILWNFQAQNYLFIHSHVPGSILAPFADVTNNPTLGDAEAQGRNWGLVEGQVVVNLWESSVQINDEPYIGCVPTCASADSIAARRRRRLLESSSPLKKFVSRLGVF